MKTKMKMFAAIAMTMGFVSGAMAQGQFDDATIKGNAIVCAKVAVSAGTSLDFVNVTPGVDKTISLSGVATGGTVTGTETAGHFFITKGANTQVTLAFTTLPSTLSGSGTASGSSLPISYTAQLLIGSTTIHPIDPPTNGSTVVVANSSTTKPFFETDAFQLDLGGKVAPTQAQEAGSYQSDITLTATYN